MDEKDETGDADGECNGDGNCDTDTNGDVDGVGGCSRGDADDGIDKGLDGCEDAGGIRDWSAVSWHGGGEHEVGREDKIVVDNDGTEVKSFRSQLRRGDSGDECAHGSDAEARDEEEHDNDDDNEHKVV